MWNRIRQKLAFLATHLLSRAALRRVATGGSAFRPRRRRVNVGAAAMAYGGAAWVGMPRHGRGRPGR